VSRTSQLLESVMPKDISDYFYKRTHEHIARVISNINKIIKVYPNKFDNALLIYKGMMHDASKLTHPELIPYIALTAKYANMPQNISSDKEIDNAVIHHYNVNSHHPEYHKKLDDMTTEDIIEMVADWASMSQELNNSLRAWTDKVVGSKFKFNDRQKELIYMLVRVLEDEI